MTLESALASLNKSITSDGTVTDDTLGGYFVELLNSDGEAVDKQPLSRLGEMVVNYALSEEGLEDIATAIQHYEPIEFEKFNKTYDAQFTGLRSTNNGVKVESGTAKISTIYGVTFVWNQLFDAVGTTVTPIVGATYLLQINGVRSIVVADENTATFVSTTTTDMCINLRHLYGANFAAYALTIEQFEQFFPLSYYSYDAGRLINMAITSFTSQGTDKDGNVFYKAINLPITTMTGKIDGSGSSEVIFPNGMGHAYGISAGTTDSYRDYIQKVDGVWQAVQRTHFASINLANYSWTNTGYYGALINVPQTTMPIVAGGASTVNIACDKFVSRCYNVGNHLVGYVSCYPSSTGTYIILCRDEARQGIINIAYPKATASTYILDDEYQSMLNEVFETNAGGTEIVYPSNGISPTTTPVKLKIDYPVIDYEVKRICVENWGGKYFEGEITLAEAAEVTTLNSKFRTSSIISFNELKYFTKLTSLYATGSTSATSGQFYNSDIEEVTTPAGVGDFRGAFRGSNIKRADLSRCTASPIRMHSAFRQCYYLEELDLPDGTYTAGWNYCFQSCGRLKTINIHGTADLSGVTSFGDSAISGLTALTTITGTITGININMNISSAPLTTASALVLVNGLSTTGSDKTLTLKASQQSVYEADDDFNAAVTAATANGWTIAYA